MRNQSTIVTILVILILLIAGLIYFSRSAVGPIEEDNNIPVDVSGSGGEVSVAFSEELTSRAIENMDGMMPIEGFDADLLLGAYPGGLLPQDFDGVESFEGIYRYTNGELEYERTVDMPITSAERTVSSQGYETLLENISVRLGRGIETRAEALALVDELDPS